MDLDDKHKFARDGELPAKAKTLWHGRFTGGPSESLMAYTVSLSYDQRMWRDDIAGSKAHVRGLARVGLLTEDEGNDILSALDQVGVEMESATFEFVASDEDIHTAIERRVTEIAGPAGGNCTPRAAATIRSPPTFGCGVSGNSKTLRFVSSRCKRPCSNRPLRRVTRTFPVTPTCSAHSPCSCRIT
jgi:hypothetical protein